ncbi:MAG: VCBS repeat-containing protein [Planctomycetota bacterium]|nr:VCBS repeat-containing protein [Planctomycetota bacterium]
MKYVVLVPLVVCTLLICAADGFANGLVLNLGPEEFVEANGVDIGVGTYSVPSYVDWNNDGLEDLIIGCGDGKVRVYLNVGTESTPQFSGYFYAKSNGVDLYCPPAGCMGCFPRVVYWDADPNKDLLVGQADGTVKIFLNTGTDENPTFDGGTLVQWGQPGAKQNINVGGRATPTVVDWNNDGKKDLVVGALDGKINIFLNGGADTAPDFFTRTWAQADGSSLVVPPSRSSPVILDLDGDGKKDLLTGNYNGELLFYSNVATDIGPAFSGYVRVDSNGVPIDLSGTPRSRPFVCDWTGDGYLDVLIGEGDGKVHLYRNIPPGDMDKDYNVDFIDFALFAQYWQQTGCGKCGGADIAGSDGNVDVNDLQQFTENWLVGVSSP